MSSDFNLFSPGSECFFFFFLLPAWEKWFKLAVNTFCSPSVSFISFRFIRIEKNRWHVIQYAHKLSYLFQLEFRSLRLKGDFHRLCCGYKWTDCHSAPDSVCWWSIYHKGERPYWMFEPKVRWQRLLVERENDFTPRQGPQQEEFRVNGRVNDTSDTADSSVSCFYTNISRTTDRVFRFSFKFVSSQISSGQI